MEDITYFATSYELVHTSTDTTKPSINITKDTNKDTNIPVEANTT
ncbi:10196_t:CDS:2 [Dentiscutata heterogama]|uniref:10196_t:CDS:1 n=1 Tax=Dentiscutata heterogama TaxID=1316150 RepID=A0ACA9KYD0_9GLOM|nr:10196_t:CDS:2 [Dentiscutata heterogama]